MKDTIKDSIDRSILVQHIIKVNANDADLGRSIRNLEYEQLSEVCLENPNDFELGKLFRSYSQAQITYFFI